MIFFSLWKAIFLGCQNFASHITLYLLEKTWVWAHFGIQQIFWVNEKLIQFVCTAWHLFIYSSYTFADHSSWQWLLGPKKSSSKSTNIGPKAHIVATWETIKKLKNNTPLGDSSYHALPNLPKWLDILA